MDESSETRQVVLKPKEEIRLRTGHPWVFSNQILEARNNPSAGDLVEVLTKGGKSVGFGLFNPHSLIACRLLSRTHESIGKEFFVRRISKALQLREKVYPGETAYRLVHGEADFLPGLVIDRYNEYLSVQTFSFGMDTRLPLICDAIEEILSPRGIIERNESPLRALEQLPARTQVLRGSCGTTVITEHGIRYFLDPLKGQKTGFYLDQRENRLSIRRFSNAAEVLDCFCNEGGFSLNAASAGAVSVTGIDSSSDAIERATANARLNDLPEVQFRKEDVFEALKDFRSAGRQFDVLVLDPPSFTRSKKNVQTAKRGYRDLNELAMRCLRSGGVLLTASCSHHIRAEVFRELIGESAIRAGRNLQELDWRGAAPDHPVLPSVPETGYLKFGTYLVH
jgi:23S rRNA (cytosine1962-C5)-methyltransferase